MTKFPRRLRHLQQLAGMLLALLVDALRYLGLRLRPPAALERATHATRIALIWLAHWFDWRQAVAVVQPATFIRWHRQGFPRFWRWKSTRGRPPILEELRALIRRMACDNPSWGEERIANELLLTLGLRVSPRTGRKYMPQHFDRGRNHGIPFQRWRTFVRNQAQAIVACDFCVVVTATSRLLYVFVVMEHATRRMLHANVTAHPRQHHGPSSNCAKRSPQTIATAS
jgi:putative transposase